MSDRHAMALAGTARRASADVMTVKSKRYPTERDRAHQAIEVEKGTYCGDAWCDGRCGLPALTVKYDSEGTPREARAVGSAVACGPVFQGFRVPWIGLKVYREPATDDERAALFKLMWW